MSTFPGTMDGCEAAASVAYRLSESIAIYPITPSTPMGELSDAWAVAGRRNIWGGIPGVTEMQSEGGVAGTLHGLLQAGALATTFTSSQGLLLMIPNLYKIAGELTPMCMHVAARTVATHALSIFGDHSDVMACRPAGMALLASTSVQEAHDLAAIGHAATLESRIPFLHFFEGFRVSHEINKIDLLSDEDLAGLVSAEAIAAHRKRALSPDHPTVRGTAQNPDTFFQAREACNRFYERCPEIVLDVMQRFGQITGRHYAPFTYEGHPEAEHVIVAMGAGTQTARATAAALNAEGRRTGVLTVHLYRPFAPQMMLDVLPASTKAIAVLDRTKEPGAVGDPLFQDIYTAIREAEDCGTCPLAHPTIINGRYGLSSKEFTPAMVRAIFDELAAKTPRRRFTVGIVDDVTNQSLEIDDAYDIEDDDSVRAVFFGLGSDGTVGANKNSIKIIGEQTENHVQGFFIYDSKKSGAVTVSHLRFGPRPFRAPYLIPRASFVACHQFELLGRLDPLALADKGACFLLNAPYAPDEVWSKLPADAQRQIVEKQLRCYVINAEEIARNAGLGRRINTVMQTCFFALSGVLPRDEAIAQINQAIEKAYAKQGAEIVARNHAAVADSLAGMHEFKPGPVDNGAAIPPLIPTAAPDFVQRVTGAILAGQGDGLPVSAFPVDGTWPTNTSRWEKRNIAADIPIWESDLCIQCNKCAFVCPHAAIRAKVVEPETVGAAPDGFRTVDYKAKDFSGLKYTLQVAPEDCTGCKLCVNVCPAKDRAEPKRKAINMANRLDHLERERTNYDYFLDLPEVDPIRLQRWDVKGVQLLQPLFEYSGACAGCGETPYIKLLTQLFGDRALIANATGCSSIYGGNLPTTPYAVNADGRGPAWANSLFEDNAEFGLGFRLAVDAQRARARALLERLRGDLSAALVDGIMAAEQDTPEQLAAQRERVSVLRGELAGRDAPEAAELALLSESLVRRSVWIVGGDGWAFDIGYGGLDHVLGLGHDVNILVLDTEVYSNTGGQASKATPLGAVAKFATAGKAIDKKDLGLMAMHYGHVYVASIAFGANDNHTVEVFREAESFRGPSLIIAYSHCIAHGYDMQFGVDQQKRAVQSGIWPLYRYDPRRVAEGQPPLKIDSKGKRIPVKEYMSNEARFRMVEQRDPERFSALARAAQQAAEQRIAIYEHMAGLRLDGAAAGNGQ